MPTGPRDWTPREREIQAATNKLITLMKTSGQAEAVAIAEFLDSAIEDEGYDLDLMEAILEQFEEWAQAGRKEINKIKKRSR